MRRAIQVLAIALMTAGLVIDNSRRRAASTSDKPSTCRLPLVLFSIGAVLLVLASL